MNILIVILVYLSILTCLVHGADMNFTTTDKCSHQMLVTTLTHTDTMNVLPEHTTDKHIILQSSQEFPRAQPTPNRNCRFSMTRTPKGLILRCQCRHISSSEPANIIEGINPSCLRNCLQRRSISSACEEGDISSFKHLAKRSRTRCCTSCAGLQDGDTCVRPGPFSAPQQSQDECVISFPQQPYGEQLACSCSGRVVVISPIMYSGVYKNCLIRCARRRMESICVRGRGRSALIDGMLDVFAECCENCDGEALDGGLACGVRA